MNPDNFLVRPHLELVERFRTPEAWETITLTDLAKPSKSASPSCRTNSTPTTRTPSASML